MQHSSDATHEPGVAPALSVSGGRQERIAWLDIARGLSILLVVIFHSSIEMNYLEALHPEYWKINNFFSNVRMPLFFAVSGILGSKIVKMDWPILIEKRIAVLIYIYLIWSIITIFLKFYINGELQYLEFIKIPIIPSSILWFIWSLGIYFLVTRLAGEKYKYHLMFISLIIYISVDSGYFNYQNQEHLKSLSYLFFFLLGVNFSKILLSIANYWKIAFLVSSLGYLIFFLALRWDYIPNGTGLALSLMGLVAGLSGSILLVHIPFVSALLAHLGRNTLTIYVAHNQFLKMFAAFNAGIVTLPGFPVWGTPVISGIAIILALLLRSALEAVGGGWLYRLPHGIVDWLRSRTDAKPRQSI